MPEHPNLGATMAGERAMVKRGRPLSFVSVKVLEKIDIERTMTSAQLSTALQLSRRDATIVCSKLASAGHLEVVARNGRAHVYARAEPASREPTWFMLGEALRP